MINVVPADRQLSGSFDGGKITEKKIIGFPHEIGTTKAYSNLFYWAYAKSINGGLIDQHPHKAFEIITYIIRGEIEHFDNKNEKWITLHAGDLQVIRAGSGIEHAEKLKADSEIFQIWFDPDITKSLATPASYNDYKAEHFKDHQTQNLSVKVIIGEGSPVQINTPGVEIKIISGDRGIHKQYFSDTDIFSVFVLEGAISGNNQYLQKGDFVSINASVELTISSEGDWKIFMIKTPAVPGYKTYTQQHG
jgi:redox-sensitive bicupin YhaK (pirin superfamily)